MYDGILDDIGDVVKMPFPVKAVTVNSQARSGQK